MAKRKQTKAARARAATPEAKAESNVIQGDTRGLDVVEQTKEARGITDETQADLAGNAGTPPPATDEQKARDKQIEERREFLEEHGTNPNDSGRGLKKTVVVADTSKKQYRGMVTVTGIHGQTHEKLSCRIDLPVACGEDYVHYCFFAHHDAAMRDPATITIDPTNSDDPNLRSRWE